MAPELVAVVGSPDFEDVSADGARSYGSWAQGLDPTEAEAFRGQPFTFNLSGAYVPRARVGTLERGALDLGRALPVVLGGLALVTILWLASK